MSQGRCQQARGRKCDMRRLLTCWKGGRYSNQRMKGIWLGPWPLQLRWGVAMLMKWAGLKPPSSPVSASYSWPAQLHQGSGCLHSTSGLCSCLGWCSIRL